MPRNTREWAKNKVESIINHAGIINITALELKDTFEGHPSQYAEVFKLVMELSDNIGQLLIVLQEKL